MSLFTGALAAGLIGAIGGGASVAASAINSHASGEAADKASASNTAALDFQKQQAEADYTNQETTRKANYDQHVAQQTSNNKIRQALGLAPVDIPAYVPSVDPTFTGAAPPAGPSIGAMAGAPPAPPPMAAPPPDTPQQRAAAALRAAPTNQPPTFLPMNGTGMTLGTIAGAPTPSGPSPWVGPTAQQLDELRKRVQS